MSVPNDVIVGTWGSRSITAELSFYGHVMVIN